MTRTACCKAFTWANALLLSVVSAGESMVIGEAVPEVKVPVVPEPSPVLLLAGALAMLMLLFRKGGPR